MFSKKKKRLSEKFFATLMKTNDDENDIAQVGLLALACLVGLFGVGLLVLGQARCVLAIVGGRENAGLCSVCSLSARTMENKSSTATVSVKTLTALGWLGLKDRGGRQP